MAKEEIWKSSGLDVRCGGCVCDSESRIYYVYVDYTKEVESRPFYVGRGKWMRVKDLRRNVKHRAIAAKYGLERKVVAEKLSIDEANQLEIELIQQLKTHTDDGFGANFTRGGDGVVRHAKESIALIKASWTDEKRQTYAERLRSDNPAKRPGFRQKAASKISVKLSGRRKSAEHRENIRLSKLGDKNPMKRLTGSKSPFSVPIERCLKVMELLRIDGLTRREIVEQSGTSLAVVKAIKAGNHWSCSEVKNESSR